MPKNHPSLTADRLREVLSYDPDTGNFRWRVNTRTRAAGATAGHLAVDGYIHVSIDTRLYKAHRLAWLYVHGVWPVDQLDHINGARAENQIANLREATCAENLQNRPRQRNNTSGWVGVSWRPKERKWQASITVNKVFRYLGCFDSASEAGAAYLEAKAQLHTFHPTTPPWSPCNDYR